MLSLCSYIGYSWILYHIIVSCHINIMSHHIMSYHIIHTMLDIQSYPIQMILITVHFLPLWLLWLNFPENFVPKPWELYAETKISGKYRPRAQKVSWIVSLGHHLVFRGEVLVLGSMYICIYIIYISLQIITITIGFQCQCVFSFHYTGSKADSVFSSGFLPTTGRLEKELAWFSGDSVFFSISRSVVHIFMANINQPHPQGPRTPLRNKKPYYGLINH